MHIFRQLISSFLVLFFVGPVASWAANTHGTPDPASERQAWWGDAFAPYIVSGCAPSVPAASLTMAAFSCNGYAEASGIAYYITQPAAAVTVPNSATVWLALHRNLGDTPSGCGAGNWVRAAGTHYLTCANATRPADPTGGIVFRKVTVAAGVITTSTPLCVYTPLRPLLATVDVRACGAVVDGSTNDTNALVAAEQHVHNVSASNVGGTILIPEGVMVISSWAPAINGLVVRGAGHFATTIKCTDAAGAGDDCILLQNISRHHWQDLSIDANSDKTSTLRFVAQVGNSNAEHVFTNVRFLGAQTNTINFDDAGGGSPNDISQNTFVSCYVRSAAPANAQVRINAANALSNRFLGGQISAPGAGSPFNIDLQNGQITLFDVFLAGSTTYDINAASGQFQSYGGRTESTGGFFHSLSTDPSNDERAALHIIQGMQVSNTGALSVHHEARRGLLLTGNFFNQNVKVGQDAGGGNPISVVIANANAFATGKNYVYATAPTNGQLFSVHSTNGQNTEIADGRMRDLQLRTISYQSIPVFTSGDTTPSVGTGMVFKTANLGATSITTFDDGFTGQIITLIFGDALTTLVNGATLKLSGAVNFVSTTNDVMTLVFDTVTWFEVSRSVN